MVPCRKKLQVRGEPGANEPRLRASSRGRKGDANLPPFKLNRERNRDIRSKVTQHCGSDGTCCPPDPTRLLHTRPRGVCRFHAKGKVGAGRTLVCPAAYALSSAPCGLKHMGKACGDMLGLYDGCPGQIRGSGLAWHERTDIKRLNNVL